MRGRKKKKKINACMGAAWRGDWVDLQEEKKRDAAYFRTRCRQEKNQRRARPDSKRRRKKLLRY